MKFAAAVLLLFLPATASPRENFSGDSALVHVRFLAKDIGPRPMGSPAEQRALEYARERFREYGCDTSFIMPFTHSSRDNTTSGIAVGIARGQSDESICIGAHIDSEGPEIEGANDNASGSAVVLELARILAPTRHRSTLVFCCFGGEEEGLEGSRYFVAHYDRIGDINFMIQLDMADGASSLELDPNTYGTSGPSWLVRAVFEEAGRLNVEGLSYPTHSYVLNYLTPMGASSDHASFLEKGIPAISFTSDLNYPIHTPRDVLELFTPSGLGRSGTLTAALVERFDGGIPERKTESYLLYVAGSQLFFLTPPLLITFLVLTTGTGLLALIGVRRRRLVRGDGPVVRWSTMKVTLFALIILIPGWFSSDLIGFINGVRLPWYASPMRFWWLAGTFCLVGVWIAARIEQRLPVTQCPYALFKRAFIFLSLGILVSLPFGMGPAFYPAVALFLLSLAIILRPLPVRILLAASAIYFPGKLIFSKWGEFWFRTVGTSIASSQHEIVIAVMTGLILCLFLAMGLPMIFGLLALINDTASLKNRGGILRSAPALAFVLILAGVFVIWTSRVPAYTSRWHSLVTVNERFDRAQGSREIAFHSPEYLDGIRVRTDRYDTTFGGKQVMITLPSSASFDEGLLKIERDDAGVEGDTLATDLQLTLHSRERPLSVHVTYIGTGGSDLTIETDLTYRKDEGTFRLAWYAFPDTLLRIPLRIRRAAGSSVTETIEVTYARLMEPAVLEREMTMFIPRTTITDSHTYLP